MPNGSARHLDLADGNAPLIGGRGDKHRARGGAGLAHLVVTVEHRGRPGGTLHAHVEIRVEREVHRRMLDAHLAPVGVEFFGGECRQPGKRTLSHLQVLGDHRHGVVGGNSQECVGRRRYGTHRRCIHPPDCLPAGHGRQQDSDDQATAGLSQKGTARSSRHVRRSFRRLRGSLCGSGHKLHSGKRFLPSRHRCRRR